LYIFLLINLEIRTALLNTEGLEELFISYDESLEVIKIKYSIYCSSSKNFHALKVGVELCLGSAGLYSIVYMADYLELWKAKLKSLHLLKGLGYSLKMSNHGSYFIFKKFLLGFILRVVDYIVQGYYTTAQYKLALDLLVEVESMGESLSFQADNLTGVILSSAGQEAFHFLLMQGMF